MACCCGGGGICCAPGCFNVDHDFCDIIGGRWEPNYTNADCDGVLGYNACDCHCLPCVGHRSHISGPTHVSFDWSYTDPISGNTFSGSVSNEPLVDIADCPGTYTDGGYYSTCWFYSTDFPSCSVGFGDLTVPGNFSRPRIVLQLTYYCGPCGDAPVGWYMFAGFVGDMWSESCADLYACGNTCTSLGNTDVFLEDTPAPFTVTTTDGSVSGTLVANCIM